MVPTEICKIRKLLFCRFADIVPKFGLRGTYVAQRRKDRIERYAAYFGINTVFICISGPGPNMSRNPCYYALTIYYALVHQNNRRPQPLNPMSKEWWGFCFNRNPMGGPPPAFILLFPAHWFAFLAAFRLIILKYGRHAAYVA